MSLTRSTNALSLYDRNNNLHSLLQSRLTNVTMPNHTVLPATKHVEEACGPDKPLFIIGCIAHEKRTYKTTHTHDIDNMAFFQVLQDAVGENKELSWSKNRKSEGIPNLIEGLEKDYGKTDPEQCRTRVINYDAWVRARALLPSTPTNQPGITSDSPERTLTVYKNPKTGGDIEVDDFQEDESQTRRSSHGDIDSVKVSAVHAWTESNQSDIQSQH